MASLDNKKDIASQQRSVSRRPNLKAEGPLDVEPLEVRSNQESSFSDTFIPLDGNELEDPW